MSSRIRPPAVAGLFYPADPDELLALIAECRRVAGAPAGTEGGGRPKAVIAPHAGYVYSGPVAARVYAALEGLDGIRRVVVLGPVHRVPVRGIAVPEVEAFATPLGTIPLDLDGIDLLATLPFVVRSDLVHAQEHSIEVQLPFLQTVLGAFSLIPMAVGDCHPEWVAEALETVWGGDETLIVVSSDFSHYHDYETARALDEATAAAILRGAGPLNHEQACGATPINGLLVSAPRHGLSPRLVALANSGDTAGDRERVVGYGGFVFAGRGGAS